MSAEPGVEGGLVGQITPSHLDHQPLAGQRTAAVTGGVRGARRTVVLVLAAITALTEVASVAGSLPYLGVADLDVSASLIPAVLLAVACGTRLFGRARSRRAATGYWVGAAILAPTLAVGYWRAGRFGWYPGLVASAFGEELVYRLAIPAVMAAVLRLGGIRARPARIAGLIGAGLWFVLLPGHREQMHSPASTLSFVAFAALAAVMVYRSGSILPMAIAHAVSNLLTVLMWQHELVGSVRSAGLACVLALLAAAYGRSSRITVGDDGTLVDIHTGLQVTAIDLRDGHAATVELADGRTVPVHPDTAVPPSMASEAEAAERQDPLDDPVPSDLREVAEVFRQRVRDLQEERDLGLLPRTLLGASRTGELAMAGSSGSNHRNHAEPHPVDDMLSALGLHHAPVPVATLGPATHIPPPAPSADL